MLLEDFYNINNLVSDESEIKAIIKLNHKHNIYKGHFPEQPVVPGVIQLQIIKEILELKLEKQLFMKSVSQVKYFIPILPTDNNEIEILIDKFKIEEKEIKITASLFLKSDIATKAKLIFKILDSSI